MWTREQMGLVVRSKAFAVAAASATSLASGLAVGHILTKRQLETKYSAITQHEIDEAKAFYSQRNKTGEFSDPNVLAEKYAGEEAVEELLAVKGGDEVQHVNLPLPGESMEDAEDRYAREAVGDLHERLKYHSDPKGVERPSEQQKGEVKESIRQNIFDNRDPVSEEDDEFDLERELEKRTNGGPPFIISHDEFFEGELEYTQNTLTFFEGDDVLVDEADQPIRDVRGTIGEENLKFGYGSKDGNIVYVRNEKLEVDFEVTRSFGKYSEEVLGFIEHADKPRPRKFKVRD